MDIGKHIQAIVEMLGTEAERIPLRRAVRLCLADVDALRNRGLTWERIASRLTEAGARDKAGRGIAAHNLRTEYARLTAERDACDVDTRMGTHQPVRDEHGSSRKPVIKSVSATVRAPSPAWRSGRLAEILKTRPRPIELGD